MVASSTSTGLRSESVRRGNLSAVLAALRAGGALSRSELVENTGLTRSAVGSLIGELVDRQLVVEAGDLRGGQPGRPSAVAEVDARQVGALAIDIGIDELAAAVVSLRGEVVDVARMSRPRGQTDLAATLLDVVDLVRRIRYADGRVDDRRIVGIGVAVAALVGLDNSLVITAPNLGWSNVPLAEMVSDALGGHCAVRVGNDGHLGGVAESRFGAGRGARHMIFVDGEVGVGGGLIIDGDRLTGRSGISGEIGHLPVNPSGALCGCGGIGCWETEIGERALLRRAGHDSGGGVEALRRLIRQAESGDEVVLDALAEHGGWIAMGLTGLINVFDPDRVVMGGLFSDVWPFLGDIVVSEITRSPLGGQDRSDLVVPGRLASSAHLIGAGELAFGPLLADPVSG
jgi:predicted NBD/HSP70 family sugar kinase